MGLSPSKYIIEDYAINFIKSKEYKLTPKKDYKLPLKNIDYYFSNQITVIPIEYYDTDYEIL
jgi:hypothetical protein